MKTNPGQPTRNDQIKINETCLANADQVTRRNNAWIRRRELIASLPFFKGMNRDHLDLLTADALEMQFPAGRTIFRQGNPANRFYLILEGKVILESELQDGSVVPIQTLGPGDELGWSWMLSPISFQLSARTLEPTKAIFFYGTFLREECEQNHDLGYEIMKRIACAMATRLRAVRDQLLAHVANTKNPKNS